MKRAEFESSLAAPVERRNFPCCEAAETNIAQYCLLVLKKGIKIPPVTVDALGTDGTYTVRAIQSNPTGIKGLGPQTYLVVDTIPGLMLTDHFRIIRPLMMVPKDFGLPAVMVKHLLQNKYDLDQLDEEWYAKGMAQLLDDIVEGGIDQEGFMETLSEFEKICNLCF